MEFHRRRAMDRLAELRERRALTLRELAEMSGVAADTINQIELGHRKARPSTLRKLAKALGVEVRELFEEPALSGKAEAPPEQESSERREKTEAALATLAEHLAVRGEELVDDLATAEGFPLAKANEFALEEWALRALHDKEEPAIQRAPRVQEAMERLESVDRRLEPLSSQWFGPGELSPEQWDERHRFSGKRAERQRRADGSEEAKERPAENGA